MIELLKLLGFEEQEIDAELPRVRKVFYKLGITDTDIERGKQRLQKYYDMEIKEVRKVFGFYLRELLDTVLAREDGKTKVIYAYMAPYFNIIGSAIMSKSNKVHISIQPLDFQIVLGLIFDKIVPVFEAAEKRWLKAGAVAHCGNVKSFLGLIALDLIPRPDLVVTTGFLCETAPKTADLLHELYGIPIFCCDTCFDRETWKYAEGSKRITALGAANMRRLTRKIEEIVDFDITDDMLSEVLDVKRRFDAAMGRLRDIIIHSDPLPIRSTHEVIWENLGMLTGSLEKITGIIDTINTLCGELQERVSKGVGVMQKGAPRIMAILPAHYSDPRLEYLVGELGLALVTSDGFAVPFEEISKDPYMRMLNYFRDSITSSLAQRIPLITEACKRLNLDGVLDRFHTPCRTVAGDALVIQEAVKKELDIPVLLLEWENFDPRAYNHEEYKRKLEVFKAMLVTRAGRKMVKRDDA